MPLRASLNVSLSLELAGYMAAQVAFGRYQSASEVVRAGLRLLQRDRTQLTAGSQRTVKPDGADSDGP